jgi:cell division septation protein DedD
VVLFCIPIALTAAQEESGEQGSADSDVTSATSHTVDAGVLADIGLSDQDEPLAINRIVEAAENRVDDLEAAAQIRLSRAVSELLLTANRPSAALDWVLRAGDYARSAANSAAERVLASLELRRADVLIQLGRAEEAREAARSGRDVANDRDTRVAAIVIMAKAYATEGRMREAQDILRGIDVVASAGTLEPDTLYHLYTSAIALGEDSTASRTRVRLVDTYPDSPEALLLQEGGDLPVFAALSPTAIATGGFTVDLQSVAEQSVADGDGTQAETPGNAAPSNGAARVEPKVEQEGASPRAGGSQTYVQVGSFRDRENAQYMRSDMESMGFTAEVRSTELSESTYYQVLIPVEAEAEETGQEAVQRLVVELKERGYEGFLVSR